jgi:hypothetical protein
MAWEKRMCKNDVICGKTYICIATCLVLIGCGMILVARGGKITPQNIPKPPQRCPSTTKMTFKTVLRSQDEVKIVQMASRIELGTKKGPLCHERPRCFWNQNRPKIDEKTHQNS